VASGENQETGNIAPLTPALVSSMRRQGQFGESCFEFDCDRPPHRWLFALKPAARSKQLLDFEAPTGCCCIQWCLSAQLKGRLRPANILWSMLKAC